MSDIFSETIQSIYMYIPVMMYSIDKEGRIITVSNYWLEQLGFEREEVIGRKSSEFLTEKSRRYAHEVILPDFFQTGVCTDASCQFVKKNGEIMDVLLSATAEKDEDENVVRSLVVLVDVTAQKRAEAELKRSEQKLRSLFDYANDSIVTIDPFTGRFLDCNLNAYKRLGYSKDELLQLTVADLHDDLTLDDIKAIFEKQILGKSMRIETIHKKKDGTYMPVEVTSTLIALGDQKVLQSFTRDISKRRKTEEEKEQLIAELKKALDEIKTLRGILPLCSFCKKIRDDKGYWERVDVYIHKHLQADISHSICPECMQKHYPEYSE